jgi:hypothetical protein
LAQPLQPLLVLRGGYAMQWQLPLWLAVVIQPGGSGNPNFRGIKFLQLTVMKT